MFVLVSFRFLHVFKHVGLLCSLFFSYVLNPIIVYLSFNMFICYHMFGLGFLSFNVIYSHVHTLMP